jgi:hypothetical protein
MKKIILLIVLVAVAIAAWVAYSKFKEETPDIVNRKADYSLSAESLIAAFDRDSSSARKMYVDKLLEVTGMVKSIDTTGSVVLGTEGNPSEVVIGFDRRHINDVKKIKIGGSAIIQGRCSGYSKGSGDDLLASLGTTVQISFAGIKDNK